MAATGLSRADVRHLLRRLAFAATIDVEAHTVSLGAAAVLATVWAESAEAPLPPQAEFLERPWTNSALAYTHTPAAMRDAARIAQRTRERQQTEQLRQAWLTQMIRGPGLRENLTLFLHSFFGSSSESVEIPHALHARNVLLAQTCMTSVPEILEALALDAATMIQIGMDGHGPDRVSDRPAKLILEHWTVGPGAYADADVAELSRALTGWSLEAADRTLVTSLDPTAPRAMRRTGIVPEFDAARFEAGPKTILGATRDFDARAALRFLAMQRATARRFGGALIRHLGVAEPAGGLLDRLEETYLATGGSIRELLNAVVLAPEFWADASRWALIKSPVHLAVGACRQLRLAEPPAAALSTWLAACGQTLFDTPNNGERGWPGQEAWITPADRLALRYRLPQILAGAPLEYGLASRPARAEPTRTRPAPFLTLTATELTDVLDAAPGFARALRQRSTRRDSWTIIESVMATPHYQLA